METRELWSVRGSMHWSENPPIDVLLFDSQVSRFRAAVASMDADWDSTEIVLVAYVAPWRVGEPGVYALPTR